MVQDWNGKVYGYGGNYNGELCDLIVDKYNLSLQKINALDNFDIKLLHAGYGFSYIVTKNNEVYGCKFTFS